MDENGVTRANVDYWDYWRETKDEAGQSFRQFVFVHMNSENGWFRVFKGQEITPQKIVVV